MMPPQKYNALFFIGHFAFHLFIHTTYQKLTPLTGFYHHQPLIIISCVDKNSISFMRKWFFYLVLYYLVTAFLCFQTKKSSHEFGVTINSYQHYGQLLTVPLWLITSSKPSNWYRSITTNYQTVFPTQPHLRPPHHSPMPYFQAIKNPAQTGL